MTMDGYGEYRNSSYWQHHTRSWLVLQIATEFSASFGVNGFDFVGGKQQVLLDVAVGDAFGVNLQDVLEGIAVARSINVVGIGNNSGSLVVSVLL